MSNVVSIHDRHTRAWEEYVDATLKAQETLSFDDGMEAGRAYRRFLDLFLTEDQRQQIGSRKASA